MAELPLKDHVYVKMSKSKLLRTLQDHPMLVPDPQLMSFRGNADAIREALEIGKEHVGDLLSLERLSKYQAILALGQLDTVQRQASFPMFQALPRELRDKILESVWTRTPVDQTSHPATFGLTRELHLQAEKIFHGHRGGNTITIMLYSQVVTTQRARAPFFTANGSVAVPATPRIDKYYTSAWVYLGKKLPEHGPDQATKLAARFDASEKDLAGLADEWPMFVRKAANINLVVRLSAAGSTKKKPHDFLEEHPYLQMNYLIYSLAYSAKACKKLNVELEVSPGGFEDPKSQAQILAGLCVFRNVRAFSLTGMNVTYSAHLKDLVEKRTKRDAIYWTTSANHWHKALPYYQRLRFLLKLARAISYFAPEQQADLDETLLKIREQYLTTIEVHFGMENYAPHALSTHLDRFLKWLDDDVFRHAPSIARWYHTAVTEKRIEPLWYAVGEAEPADEFGYTPSAACGVLGKDDRGDWEPPNEVESDV